MDLNLGKLKTMLVPRPTKLNLTGGLLNPEVGFKITHNSSTKQIKLSLLSARHLPSIFGLNRVEGYIFKVKLFPGKEKFETELRTESWPAFNQDFVFTLEKPKPDAVGQLNGRFLVITAYAILERAQNGFEATTPLTKKDKLKKFYNDKVAKVLNNKPKTTNNTKEKVIVNLTFEKRRTIGSVTYTLNWDNLKNVISHNVRSTDEIWKNLQDISTSLSPTEASKKENKKGDFEVGLVYQKSEDGETCSFTLSLLKMRCSLQIMQLHEQLNGSLYIKLRILNGDEVLHKGKTEPFPPSISHKFAADSTNIKSRITITELEDISFQFILISKDKIGHKDTLGTIVLSSKSKGSYLTQWEKALESPGTTITCWQPLQ